MVCGELPDWISAIANSMLALAAIVAAWQGWKSLRSWKEQAQGVHRLELAVELLTGFHEAREILEKVRFPIVRNYEFEARPDRETEASPKKEQRDKYYAVLVRLEKSRSKLAAFEAKKFRAVSLFGLDAEKLFIQIMDVHNDLNAAAKFLYYNAPSLNSGILDEDEKVLDSMLFAFSKPKDEIGKRVEDIVAQAESYYRPLMEK